MLTTAPSSASAPPAPVLGLSVLALLVVGVAGWLWAERPDPDPDPDPDRTGVTTEAPGAVPAELAGFRSDAWFLPDDARLGFVEVPAGPFVMGNDPGTDAMAFANERWSAAQAQGLVDLPAFYIGRYEVTVAQFDAFARDTGFTADLQARQAPPDHPVSSVSWPDALAYCRWLDRVLRQSSESPPELRRLLEAGWRVTLPTEAQWEKAARSADGRVYPWGGTPRRDRANYSGPGTAPVGSAPCPECPFGLSDMSGNVWEWTRSPYQPYPFTAADDLDRLGDDALWVMRGGSFTDSERNVRTAVRGGADPGARRPFIGFRVVIAPRN